VEYEQALASLNDASIAGGYAAQSTPEAKLQWLKDAIVSFDIGSASGTTFFYSGNIAQYQNSEGTIAITSGRSAVELVAKENTGAARVLEITDAGKFIEELQNNNITLIENLAGSLNSTKEQLLYVGDDALWNLASTRYAQTASGDVISISPYNRADSAWVQYELPALLANDNVTSINGIARETLVAKYDAILSAGNLTAAEALNELQYHVKTPIIDAIVSGEIIVDTATGQAVVTQDFLDRFDVALAAPSQADLQIPVPAVELVPDHVTDAASSTWLDPAKLSSAIEWGKAIGIGGALFDLFELGATAARAAELQAEGDTLGALGVWAGFVGSYLGAEFGAAAAVAAIALTPITAPAFLFGGAVVGGVAGATLGGIAISGLYNAAAAHFGGSFSVDENGSFTGSGEPGSGENGGFTGSGESGSGENGSFTGSGENSGFTGSGEDDSGEAAYNPLEITISISDLRKTYHVYNDATGELIFYEQGSNRMLERFWRDQNGELQYTRPNANGEIITRKASADDIYYYERSIEFISTEGTDDTFGLALSAAEIAATVPNASGDTETIYFDSSGALTRRVTVERFNTDNAALTVETLYENGVAVDRHVKSITYNGNVIPAGEIGAIFGSQLGLAIGGDDLFASIATATVLETLLENVGQLLQNSYEISLLAQTDPTLSTPLGDAVEITFEDFGAELIDNLAGQINNLVSSLIAAELADAIGLEGVAADIAAIAGATVTSQILSNLGQVVESGAPLTAEALFAGLDAAALGPQIATMMGSYFGRRLGGEVIEADSQEGAIGGSIGAAIGSLIGRIVFSAIPFIGTFIGSFIGKVVGTWIGDLFGDEEHPQAYAKVHFNAETGHFEIYQTDKEDGGSRSFAEALAENAISAAEAIVDSMGATIDPLHGADDWKFGHYENTGYAKTLDGSQRLALPITADEPPTLLLEFDISGLREESQISEGYPALAQTLFASHSSNFVEQGYNLPAVEKYTHSQENPDLLSVRIIPESTSEFTNDTPARLIEFGISGLLRELQIIGGHPVLRRAFYASRDGDLDTLIFNLSIAQNFVLYLEYTGLINALIAAEPMSEFAAGWIVTLQLAEELGLNRASASDFLGGFAPLLEQLGLAGQFTATPDFDGTSLVLHSDDAAEAMVTAEDFFGPGANRKFVGTQSADAIDVEAVMQTEGLAADALYAVVHVDGSAGGDTIHGHAGSDLLIGGDGNDTINGRAGADWITGGAGEDFLSGGAGDDLVYGGEGDDVLDGSTGEDLLIGGAGDDIYRIGLSEGFDVIDNTLEKDIADTDTIAFQFASTDQAATELTLQRQEHDLLITINPDDTSSVLVKEFFGAGSIDQVTFTDGVSWSGDDLINKLVTDDDTRYVHFDSDTFIFTDLSSGMDVIDVFEDGIDRLDSGSRFSFDDLAIEQVGNDTLLTIDEPEFGMPSIMLTGFNATQFSADDLVA
jgi:hypothetical protein